MEIVIKLGKQIVNKITNLISLLEGIKLDSGVSPWDIRQWKKDKKNDFASFIQKRDRIFKVLSAKQKQKEGEIERKN